MSIENLEVHVYWANWNRLFEKGKMWILALLVALLSSKQYTKKKFPSHHMQQKKNIHHNLF